MPTDEHKQAAREIAKELHWLNGWAVSEFSWYKAFDEAFARHFPAPSAQTEGKYRERLKKLSFLITGNDYAFLSENPEIEEAIRVFSENQAEARSAETPRPAEPLCIEAISRAIEILMDKLSDET